MKESPIFLPDQVDGHELGEAAEGSLHAVAKLQALPGFTAGGGRAGQGVVWYTGPITTHCSIFSRF